MLDVCVCAAVECAAILIVGLGVRMHVTCIVSVCVCVCVCVCVSVCVSECMCGLSTQACWSELALFVCLCDSCVYSCVIVLFPFDLTGTAAVGTVTGSSTRDRRHLARFTALLKIATGPLPFPFVETDSSFALWGECTSLV